MVTVVKVMTYMATNSDLILEDSNALLRSVSISFRFVMSLSTLLKPIISPAAFSSEPLFYHPSMWKKLTIGVYHASKDDVGPVSHSIVSDSPS